MRVIVCGSRGWKQYGRLGRRLGQLPREGLTIIHGAARGADSCAGDWCLANGVEWESYPANWRKHGRAAGPIRNRQMLESGADLVLAFRCHGESRGTDDMIAIARAAGVPVEVIEETT